MTRNYLLHHIRKDGLTTLVFCPFFAAAGIYPWLEMVYTPQNGSLRCAGLAAVACS